MTASVSSAEGSDPVAFTVIIPTYERPAQLGACLAAVARLHAPPGGFEVVVVNDGGTTSLDSALAPCRDALGAECVRLVHQPNAGPAAARNSGARVARGQYLAFTDDDCLPEPEWLVAFERALRDVPGALVGGRTVNALEDNLFCAASQSLVDFAAGYFDGGAAGRFFPSNNLAVPRGGFLDAGGFDARHRFAGEDRELCDRWWHLGRPSTVAPGARIRHAHALSARDFIRQHVAYGRGAVAFRHTRRGAGRPVRIDPAFYAASLRYPFTQGSLRRAAPVALLTAVAHAAYAAGLLAESVRHTHTR